MAKTFAPLRSRVKHMLHANGYGDSLYALDEVADTIDGLQINIQKKVTLYKWLGFSLLISIPVLSTILSFLISEKSASALQWFDIAKWCSYLLTMLTLLNSIFKPNERFREVCAMGVEVGRLRSDFILGIENRLDAAQDKDVNERNLTAFAQQIGGKLATYQKQLISLFLPETAVSPSSRVETAAPAPEPQTEHKGKA